MSDYPEHDKLDAVKDESQAVGEFLETCGYQLCEWIEDVDPEGEPLSGFYSVRGSINEILARYYGIDLAVLEAEKRAMLDKIREPA